LQQLDEIGVGEHGTVFRADEPDLDRAVAVKVFRDRVEDEETRRAFAEECEVLSRLPAHPGIVDVHRGGITDLGEPYLVMDLVETGSLADRLRRDGPLSWPEVLRIGVVLAAALETAHRAGVLHLSVTPTNVLLSDRGEPLLTDFGTSGLPGVTTSSDERIRASIAYTAPERLLDGAATPSADLYGLGSTLYTVLAGRPAVTTTADEDLLVAISRIVRQPVPELKVHGVPEPVQRIIERLLAKSPVDRFATAGDAVRALQAAQRATGKPVTEAVIGDPAPVRLSRLRPRRPLVPDEDEIADEEPVTQPRYVPRTRMGRAGSVAAVPAPRTSPGSAGYATAPVPVVRPGAPRSTPDALTAPIPTGFPLPRRTADGSLPSPGPATRTAPDHATGDPRPATTGSGRATTRRTAPRHAAASRTGSARAPAARWARRPLVLTAVAVAAVGLALGVGQWLSRPAAAPPAVATSTTAAPSPVAPTTADPAPTSGGAGRRIAVADDITHPARDAAADRLDDYFRALNEKDYDTAFGYFSPDSAVAGNGLAAFRKNNATTEVQRQRIVAIEDLPSDRLAVTVTYRSTQDARFGPSGATCADWRLTYELTGPDGLIRKARLITDPKPC
jgi:hypothetical protein